MPKQEKKKYELKSNEHIEQYMGLIVSWANRYTKRGLGEFEDMRQEAFMVYMGACDAYNPNMGKFSTFLYTSLKNHMLNMIRNKSKEIQTVSIDAMYGEENEYIDMIESDYIHIGDDCPIIEMRYKGMTMVEIAEVLGVSRREAYRLLEKEQKNFK